MDANGVRLTSGKSPCRSVGTWVDVPAVVGGPCTGSRTAIAELRPRGSTLQTDLASQDFRQSGHTTQLAERNQAVTDRETTLVQIRQLA